MSFFILQRLSLYSLLLVTLTISSSNFAFKEDSSRSKRFQPTEQPSANGFSAEQNMAFQKMIRTMMGFSGEGLPAESNSYRFNKDVDGGKPEVPEQRRATRYMYRLYEKYLTGEPVKTESQVADTVRNINSDLVIVNNGSLFVFNLSSLDETETVLRAELHLYKRKIKLDSESKDLGFLTIKVYDLGPRTLRERAALPLPESGHARWHSFDVTTAVQSLFSVNKSDGFPRLLALSFTAEGSSNTSGNPEMNLRVSKILRRLSKPCLVIFSQDNHRNLDSKLNTIFRVSEELESQSENTEKKSWRWNFDNPLKSRGRNHLTRRRGVGLDRARLTDRTPEGSGTPMSDNSEDEVFEMESFSLPESKWKQGEREFQRHEVEEEMLTDTHGKFYHADFPPVSETISTKQRLKRFIVDNEIPQKEDEESELEDEEEEAVQQIHFNRLLNTGPGILNGRSKSGKRNQSVTIPPIVAFGEDANVDEDALKRRMKEDRKAREKDMSLFAFASRSGVYQSRSERRDRRKHTSRRRPSHSGVCGRRRLWVDFADIGWKEWIIAPKSFEAYYCDGKCLYPMASSLHPTNHATIQSIVKAIGLQSRVPSPCCIPSSLSSVTLLYLDQNGNVVLKNFPDMTVKSCACR